MNIREAGAQRARRLTTGIAIAGAALASLIGASVLAGTAAAQTSTGSGTGSTVDDGGQQPLFVDDSGANGLVGPGQGGGSHGISNGS